MAQVIKIEDYISRYEIDPYRYSNQFIRYKKIQWDTIKNEVADESLDERKQQFLEHIFYHQIIWASSTVRSQSHVKEKYYKDLYLKNFALRFPDQYFLMYYPVFFIKNAPVESEIILICPTVIFCMTILDGEEDEVVHEGAGHFWIRRSQKGEKRLLAPTIPLNRTEGIVKQALTKAQVEMPVKKLIIHKRGYIHAPKLSFNFRAIDKREYQQWFERMKQHSTPIKHTQLKVVKALLSMCLTNSYERFEFEL
ncbi:NERD domain-containing protein [Aeribacillus alveayuensis]|uniref:NERD domain-containing protein n=1 Tax=Aeribacillus alveayuensis TaxID=279215 RepID=A0ABT9VJC3_9BACI|nr:hypothetical protein [Bacillus alveayuensis]